MKSTWTVKDLHEAYLRCDHCKVGYCCLQNDGLSAWDNHVIELGTNKGLYGWNWTAYLNTDTCTLYVDCYRNVPGYIKEK